MRSNLLRLTRATLLTFALGAFGHAGASAPPTNYSDLWGRADESGWGLNLSQQANIIFGTLFAYGTGEQAVWYSATFTYQYTAADNVVVYGGDLYQTSGSPQGTPWNPALLNYLQVGTATLEFGDDAHALLRYTVGGTVVVKQITRQTFAAISPVGTFIGGTTDVTFNCRNPARNGIVTTDPGQLRITLDGDGITIHAPTCYYEGRWVQQGQVGSLDGRYECTNNALGAVVFSGLRFENGGFVGNYTGHDSSCEFRGNIGGVRLLE